MRNAKLTTQVDQLSYNSTAWGISGNDLNREIANNLRKNLIAGISDLTSKTDRVQEISQMYEKGEISAFFAMGAIGAIFAETEETDKS